MQRFSFLFITGLLSLSFLVGCSGSSKATVTPTATVTSTATSSPSGAIEVTLGYPSDGTIPALTIYAVDTTDAKHFYSLPQPTTVGIYTVTLKNIAPGTYHILAYLDTSDPVYKSLAGGWTQFALCKPGETCPEDHTLLGVNVKAAETTKDIQLTDWYAPPGTFPPRPSA